MKKNFSTILLSIIFIAGVSLLLYPTVSDYWNSFHASRAVTHYAEAISSIDEKEYKRIIEEARAYNEELLTRRNRYATNEYMEEYRNVLNLDGKGMMGYIEIPIIHIQLPIYHTVDDSVLLTSIGHLEASSVPIGGPSTHTVLSGHRGLPSAKLFTNLDRMLEGDTFTIRVLDEVLTYEVDNISVVLPKELEKLEITEGEDYCTLVTCTPYGINSHRLLVRGHRIDNTGFDGTRVTADAMKIDTIITAPFFAVPMLLLLFIILLVKYRNRR